MNSDEEDFIQRIYIFDISRKNNFNSLPDVPKPDLETIKQQIDVLTQNIRMQFQNKREIEIVGEEKIWS